MAEVLGGLGLVLPAAMRVRPRLTPLASAGLALDMALATGFHRLPDEIAGAMATLVLALLSAFVA